MSIQREAIAERILKGQNVVIYNGHALLIPTAWLDRHPGGALAIQHFVGRDATDEIESYHPATTVTDICKYSIGTVDTPWKPFQPPISIGWVYRGGKWENDAVVPNESGHLLVEQMNPMATSPSAISLNSITPSQPAAMDPATQHRISKAFKALHRRVIAAGYYDTPYWTGIFPEVLSFLFLGSLAVYTYMKDWQLTSAAALGFLWHQLMFMAHDLGHMGVTHSWVVDRIVSIFIANFIGGLSISWWVENHNVHHLVTNMVCHDPDIEHLPFFAISPAFFSNIYSTYYKRTLPFDFPSRLFISVQHKLFYVVLSLARFNLYRLSYTHMFAKAFEPKRAKGGRWAWSLELVSLVTFWCWYGMVLWGCGSWQKGLSYLLVSNIATSPIHVQIVLSHFSMSTEDLGPYESFAHRQLRTTCDVVCPPWLEIIHGGLHLQVTHHLFPRMPRHNLRKASVMVKQFAKDEGLKYAEFGGFVAGNQDVLGVLQSVGEQARILAQVTKVEAREAVDKRLGLMHQSNHY